jgi:2-dehydro-3-deoxyphosphogluconate aldolase / (4S)-4-hydroxy-2-oxoglutarate aldolase
MNRQETLKVLCDVGLVPVVRVKSAGVLVDVARALAAGGVPVVEVTLTVPGAIDGIRQLVKTFGKDILVGVGSVTTAAQAEEAVAAGAEFVVGPILVPEVIQAAHRLDKVVIPGALSPTEIYQAHQLGADVVKVFPASVGGPGYFKAVLAPMPFLKLMPTGGVDLTTAAAFIRAGAVTLGAGTALVDSRAIEMGDWDTLTSLARQFREEVKKGRAK